MTPAPVSLVRLHLRVTGTVQGVGFRPFVHRIASARGLSGWVRNDGTGVQIEVEGPEEAVEGFRRDLEDDAPPLARIRAVTVHHLEPLGSRGFEIRDSGRDGERDAPIPPDAATCDACLAELRDPADRRFRYPFINCTDCGPRYTIIRAVPYDRPDTTMASFTMCPACRREYEDPADRRFHAQPNACPACGPSVELRDPRGERLETGDPLSASVAMLEAGRILAVKGLGGFHLACDASSEEAVKALRRRKGREEKPFAVMAAGLDAARRIARIGPAERDLLTAPERPIVFLQKKPGHPLAPSVAPGLRDFGVMLPYTPLHHLLMEGRYPALVMTSGNLTDEPIAFAHDDALRRLGGIADAFLVHDREIETRADDSVARVVGSREVIVRRSRGYAPAPLFLPREGPPVLAVGADLKNVPAVTRRDRIHLAHYIGDLGNLDAQEAFREAVAHLESLLGVKPAIVAHDLHPRYASTRYALALAGVERVAVQHHRAHIASVMAEAGLEEKVVGVALDGTGFGDDGTVWGGEFLAGDLSGFRRVARLSTVPMPGGDAAAREGWRMAVAQLQEAFPDLGPGEEARYLRGADPAKVETVSRMARQGVNAPLTSSMGRLFDAVSALAGVATVSTYEGQAAMELEGAAGEGLLEPYPFSVRRNGEIHVVETVPLIRAVAEDVLDGVSAGVIAGRFHASVVRMVVETCGCVADREGVDRVALSGGCFQNALLLAGSLEALQQAGFRVFTHALLPPNDGCIAAGQAAMALARQTRR